MLRFFDKDITLKADYSEYIIKNDNKLLYPENFDIINHEIYNYLTDFEKYLNTTIYKGKIKKGDLIINNGKIIFKNSIHKNLLIMNNDKNFIVEKKINFNSNEQLFDFFMKFLVHKYEEILNDELIDFIYNENNENIGNI